MKDYREIQRESARRERRALIAENVTFDKAREIAREENMAVVWHWSTGNVYGAVGSANRQEKAA